MAEWSLKLRTVWTKPAEKCTHRVLTTTKSTQYRRCQLWEKVLGKHPGGADATACMCMCVRESVCLFVGKARGQCVSSRSSLLTFPSGSASPFLWDTASPYGCSWSGQLDKLWLREEGPRTAMRSFIHIVALLLHNQFLLWFSDQQLCWTNHIYVMLPPTNINATIWHKKCSQFNILDGDTSLWQGAVMWFLFKRVAWNCH